MKKCISKEREGSRAGRRFGRSWPHALPFTGYFYSVLLHTLAQPWVPTHFVTTALVKLPSLPHWELSSSNANPTMVCGPEAYITLPWGPIILDISPYPCIPTLSSEVSAGTLTASHTARCDHTVWMRRTYVWILRRNTSLIWENIMSWPCHMTSSRVDSVIFFHFLWWPFPIICALI